MSRSVWQFTFVFGVSLGLPMFHLTGDAGYTLSRQVLKNSESVPLLVEGVVSGSEAASGKTETRRGALFYTPDVGFVGEDRVRATLEDGIEVEVLVDVRSHPNFIFILTDDQSWTSLSARMDKQDPRSRSDLHRTPHFDRLAKRGMRFSRAYSPAPNCSPSRYANLTGKSTARLQFTDIVGRNQTIPKVGKFRLSAIRTATKEIEASEVTIPEWLRSLPGANYASGHFGKWHLLGGGPESHGFDVSDGDTGNRQGSVAENLESNDPKQAYGIADRGNRFMGEAVSAGRPFYCQLSHYAVHAAIQYREETLAKANDWEDGDNHSSKEYAAMISDLDSSVGQTLDEIDRLGLRHSTYVIFQADNGAPQFMSNAYPLKRYKPEIWEGGIRVPTIVSGPGIPEHSQCDQAMMGIDILPTIWEFAGGDPNRLPKDIDGVSIASWLRGKPQRKLERPSPLVVHSPHYIVSNDLAKNQRPSSALLEGPWKLVAWYETGEVSLINLEDDVSESRDLSATRPKLALKLRKSLRDYLSAVNAQLPTLDAAYAKNPGKSGDADDDGLPDSWEFAQLLTHTLGPGDDPDGDGISNVEEFRTNSDPLAR